MIDPQKATAYGTTDNPEVRTVERLLSDVDRCDEAGVGTIGHGAPRPPAIISTAPTTGIVHAHGVIYNNFK